MYQLSAKLRLFAILLMGIGVLSITYGFLSTPRDVAAVQRILTQRSAGQPESGAGVHYDEAQLQHAWHQMQNRPWAAVLYSAFFFTAVALAVLFFYAVQIAAEVGWSVVLLRVMEAISWFVPVGGAIILIVLFCSAGHLNHLYHWMASGITDPTAPHYDAVIAAKSGYLNTPFFLLRSVVYVGGWTAMLVWMQKAGLAVDESKNWALFKRYKTRAVLFLICYAITSTTMAWDWIMSINPHWFSTLFGWYILGVVFPTAVSALAIATIYLKSKGYMPDVNDSHIHDLAKYIFAFSLLWGYLWFAQYMLYWYADIPEEVTYFLSRWRDYRIPYFAILVLNLVVPTLVLMNSDFKRIPFLVVFTGISVIIGHAIESYVLIAPEVVGKNWHMGVVEWGSWLGFLGLFIFVSFTALTKVSLSARGNPYWKESEAYRYG
ncbi:MAG: quinol:cytochrome C oxidoreductase [Flavobacteriales bacterium]